MASRFIPTVRFKRAVLWWMLFVAGPIVYGAGPWAISLLAPRSGWAAGYPGPWNLIGLIPVAVGITGLIWCVALHFAQSPEGLEMTLAQSYLLTRGPYAFSRHPTYLSEMTLLFGWVIFYGSVAVFIAFVAGCVFHFCRLGGRTRTEGALRRGVSRIQEQSSALVRKDPTLTSPGLCP
jgi:protein-S-isoprenylcysteine O-methyltransferase Ste14